MAEEAVWRVWIRTPADRFFREAFAGSVKRPEMERTVRTVHHRTKSHQDIKVMNTGTGSLLTADEIQAIVGSQ